MPHGNPTPEEFFAALAAEAPKPPHKSPAEGLMELGERVAEVRAFVEGERKKLVADGYPESVSWRMAADLWAGIWRSAGT